MTSWIPPPTSATRQIRGAVVDGQHPDACVTAITLHEPSRSNSRGRNVDGHALPPARYRAGPSAQRTGVEDVGRVRFLTSCDASAQMRAKPHDRNTNARVINAAVTIDCART